MAKKKVEESNVVVVDTDSMKKDVMAYVDSEMDKRIEKVVDEKVKKKFLEEIDQANRRLIREKNRKIFVKNIFLLVFFLLILFLVYLLYKEHFFDSYFPHENGKEEVVEKETVKPVEEEVVPTLEELKAEYASYLNPYVLSDQSVYVEDFYQGKLTNSIKNYFSLQALDFEKLEVEEDYHVIDRSSLEEACSKLFDKNCDSESFDYNGNKVRYFEKLDSYISNGLLEKQGTNIQREIIDIQVDHKRVLITTLEAVVAEDAIYSVSPREWLGEYYGEGLGNYPVNKMIYTFEKDKLVQVEKG